MPTVVRDAGKLELAADKTVEIVVEHFQIDGYAVLEFSISREIPAGSPTKAAR